MAVDWEQRVDFARLRSERLAKAQASLRDSALGAVLLFDQNNIRYVSSTHIGEWARDKSARWALLPREGDPVLWDFGSRRNTIRFTRRGYPNRAGSGRDLDARSDAARDRGTDALASRSIGSSWTVGLSVSRSESTPRHGDPHRPNGRVVEPADAQPVMTRVCVSKTADEIACQHAAATSTVVDDENYRKLVREREHEIVARAMETLSSSARGGRSDQCGRGDRGNPHPHVFSDRLCVRAIRRSRRHPLSTGTGPATTGRSTWAVLRVPRRRVQAMRESGSTPRRARPPRSHDRPDRGAWWPTAKTRLPRRARPLGLQFGTVSGRPRRGADDLARPLARPPDRDRGGNGVRPRDRSRSERRRVGGAHRGRGRRHRDGMSKTTRFPAEEPLVVA